MVAERAGDRARRVPRRRRCPATARTVRSIRQRRPADPRLPRAGSTSTRATTRDASCTACAPRCAPAARTVVLTNAAGGLRAGHAGRASRVLIADHLNLTGRSPLTGPNRDRPRAPLRRPDRGVLAPAAGPGPHGRPDAGGGRVRRVRRAAVRDAGRDPHGCARSAPTSSACPPCTRPSPPSTSAPRCSALSLVTNLAAGLADEQLDHADVLAAGRGRRPSAWAGSSPQVVGRPVTATPASTDGRRARAWLARRTPTPPPGPSCEALLDAGDADGPGRALRRPPAVRHRRPARRARRRAEPHEPGARAPGRRRPGRAGCTSTDPDRRRPRRGGRLRRPPQSAPTSPRTPPRCSPAPASAAHLLPGPLPTPVLAFAVRHLGAAAGVMVTASHNPPQDNGYKVYVRDGRQIVPPVDAEISAAIDAVGPLADVAAGAARRPARRPRRRRAWSTPTSTRVRPVRLVPGAARRSVVAYTAMHGVGGDAVVGGLRAGPASPPPARGGRAGRARPRLPDRRRSRTRRSPARSTCSLADGGAGRRRRRRSPTTPTPTGSAVAVPDPDGRRRLAGAQRRRDRRAARRPPAGRPPACPTTGRRPCSPPRSCRRTLLGKMAAAAGVAYGETLTGFKWIARAPGPGPALRCSATRRRSATASATSSRDKDGITAALVVRRAWPRSAGRGRHAARPARRARPRATALHVTRQRSIRVAGATGWPAIAGAMAALRADAAGRRWPARPVDRGARTCSTRRPAALPPSDVLVCTSTAPASIVRPSGTEPKLKCYVEVVVPVAGDVAAARAEAEPRSTTSPPP